MPSDWQAIYRKWDGIRKQLRDGVPPPPPSQQPDEIKLALRGKIITAVCHFYRIKAGTMKVKRKPRQVLCYLLHHHAGFNYEQVGRFIYRSKESARLEARYAGREYPQDINSILTALGMGYGAVNRDHKEDDRGRSVG